MVDRSLFLMDVKSWMEMGATDDFLVFVVVGIAVVVDDAAVVEAVSLIVDVVCCCWYRCQRMETLVIRDVRQGIYNRSTKRRVTLVAFSPFCPF